MTVYKCHECGTEVQATNPINEELCPIIGWHSFTTDADDFKDMHYECPICANQQVPV